MEAAEREERLAKVESQLKDENRSHDTLVSQPDGVEPQSSHTEQLIEELRGRIDLLETLIERQYKKNKTLSKVIAALCETINIQFANIIIFSGQSSK